MVAHGDSVTVKLDTIDAGVNGSSTIGATFLLGLLMAERLAWCVCVRRGGGRGGEDGGSERKVEERHSITVERGRI